MRVAAIDDDDDDLANSATPLRGSGMHNESKGRDAPRWPWVCLGLFVGLFGVLLSPQSARPAVLGLGGPTSDLGCGSA